MDDAPRTNLRAPMRLRPAIPLAVFLIAGAYLVARLGGQPVTVVPSRPTGSADFSESRARARASVDATAPPSQPSNLAAKIATVADAEGLALRARARRAERASRTEEQAITDAN